MKICSCCKTPKVLEDFPKNSSKKDGYGSQCKKCKKTLQDAWYQTHKQEHRDRIQAKKDFVRQKVQDFLSRSKCADCPNDNPIVLEFDHVRGKKRDDVSRMVANGLGWNTIKKEIDKCEVRCANCHRIKTHERRISRS